MLHMPTWYPHLNDMKIDARIAYLLSLQPKEE